MALADALGSPASRRDPYPLYARLRAEAPVAVHRPSGAYVVTRHADVVALLRDPAAFSSSIMAAADHALLGADPPQHTRVRRIVAHVFAPARMAAMDGAVRAACAEQLAAWDGGAERDLVAELAVPLPMAMIAAILGFGADRTADLKRWSAAVIASATGSGAAARSAEVAGAVAELNRFCASLIAARRRAPAGDLVSELLHGDGGALDADEVTSFIRLLLVAGNETTTNLIGNAVLALLRHPEQRARLRAEPALVPAALEEVLRHDGPVQIVLRRAAAATAIAGVDIPAGATVFAVLGAANRDGAAFADPDRFDVARAPAAQLAFGAGVHYCLGAALARRTAAVALELLLARDWHAPLAPDAVPRIDSFQLRGPASLPLRLG